MTKIERARATVKCDGDFHDNCALTAFKDLPDVDFMKLGDNVSERHAIVASLILDGEPSCSHGLKVKTGVRAPAPYEVPEYFALPVAVLNSQGAEVARQDFYAPIPCPNGTPRYPTCDICWYCIQRGAK